MSDRARASFINYPPAKEHDCAYRARPPPQNPVLTGLPLHYLATVVANVPLVPYLLWHNAGFGTLRNLPGIHNVKPRFDPTVIPVTTPNDEAELDFSNLADLRVTPPDGSGRFHGIKDYHQAYKDGKLTPLDIVDALLPLIRRDVSNRSPHSTAFTEVRVDLVRQAAEASTKRWKDGKPLSILDGVPFGAKDDLDVQGYKRHAGTKKDYTMGKHVETSWCVKKIEEAGGILMGKMNMHELGMDTTNNNPNWGTPLNPYNSNYYCGGSSGGAAYSVGAGLVPFAIGSDGGGSVRIPSSYCGLYGLKPSHGRVSIAPLISSDTSVVVRGPLAGNMADLDISYRTMAQPDPSQETSRQFRPPKLLSRSESKTIGICRPWFDRADPNVQDACHAALKYLTSELGYHTVDIDMPFLHEGQIAHAMTILAEATAGMDSLAHLTAPNKILLSVSRQTRATDYLLAQSLRHVQMQHLAHLFQKHPGLIIVTPTTPNAGWPIGAGQLTHGVSDGNMQIRNMEYVWLANFTGVPCIQFPVGYVDPVKGDQKIPIGMMGHGEWGSEDGLIRFGYDGEQWLTNGYEGGRIRSHVWVDTLPTRQNPDIQ